MKLRTFEEEAIIAYANDSEGKRRRAIGAGRAIDKSLELNYSKLGSTRCCFKMTEYLKYFTSEALGLDRLKLLYPKLNNA